MKAKKYTCERCHRFERKSMWCGAEDKLVVPQWEACEMFTKKPRTDKQLEVINKRGDRWRRFKKKEVTI